MRNTLYAICIPLSGKMLKTSELLLNKLEKKFSIKFINKKNSRPHINIFNGKTKNLEKIVSILKKRINKKYSKKIKIFGYGAFLSKSSSIYIRFENSDYIQSIRNLLFKNSKLWSKVDKNIQTNLWLPKSTIIYKDMNTNHLSNVLKQLNKIQIPLNMEINEIVVIDYSTEKENEIKKIKI
jgi:2'-5' RNA ligase